MTLNLGKTAWFCTGERPRGQSWGWASSSWEVANSTYLVQEAHEVAEDGVVVLRQALQDQAAVGHTQAALHTCNGMRLLARAVQS